MAREAGAVRDGHQGHLANPSQRKSEGRGNWELPYMASSLGKSRAEKSDGEYRPVSQEGNKKEGLCWRRDAGRSLGSELR